MNIFRGEHLEAILVRFASADDSMNGTYYAGSHISNYWGYYIHTKFLRCVLSGEKQ